MVKDLGDAKIRSDFSRFIVSNLADQIKQADTKAFGILGVLGILTAALLTRLNGIKSSLGINMLWAIFFIISAILIVISLKFLIRVVFPRLSNSKESQSLIYFKSIISNSESEYVSKGLSISSEEAIKESYKDAYQLAKIANSKFMALRYAMISVLITFIWTLGILIFSFK